ncbi:MAG: hypothetical protein WA121_13450, partial [Syntrophales bacterium]
MKLSQSNTVFLKSEVMSMGKLFGTDGIRGIANVYPLTVEMFVNIGRALVHLYQRPGHVPRIVIGKDTRLSGDMLESALVAGVCS